LNDTSQFVQTGSAPVTELRLIEEPSPPLGRIISSLCIVHLADLKNDSVANSAVPAAQTFAPCAQRWKRLMRLQRLQYPLENRLAE
jgi:hypothetical protein